ncbi:MAG: hypothetical protein KGO50_11590 [Myxococcales bacterium]|nr:hypothetical protein [Myxococcales bacterium]
MSTTFQSGLYRTTIALPESPKSVPEARLVLVQMTNEHPHPVVVLPNGVTDNRWTFGNQGFLARDADWLKSLVPLPRQGFYTLTRELEIGAGSKLPEGLLVQLGYTADGRPVIFPGQLMPGNAIQFGSRGALIGDLQLDFLKVNEFRVLAPPPAPAVADASASNVN